MRTGPFVTAAALFASALFSTLASPAVPATAAAQGEATSPRRPAPKPGPSASPGPDTDGVKFRAIGPATSGGRVTAVAGSDRDPSLYYVGGAGGGVFKSVDGGTSFQPAWDGPHFGAIGAIGVAPSDARVVWAGTGEATWRSIASNLPLGAPVRVIRQDPREPNLLYAGTENGLWISYDRGGRWERLRAGLPVVPVYDVHVQPAANDLPRRDARARLLRARRPRALQRLAAARRDGVAFFPVRDATLWASWPSVETGDGGALPANQFAGRNAPGGAVLSFFQRTKAKERPWFELADASGHVVRTLRGSYPTESGKKWFVTNDAGLNRVVWDGNENGPVRWTGTSLGNLGPLTGPEALPGTYTARLHAGGRTFEQPFRLADDPQSPWTVDQRVARHTFLANAFGWYDAIDRALNAIDARMKKATPAERARLTALRDRLTSNPLHDEDGITRPDRIRERVGGMMFVLSGSLQPPFAAHQAALDALRPDVIAALRDAANVLGPGVWQRRLPDTTGGAILTAPTPTPAVPTPQP